MGSPRPVLALMLALALFPAAGAAATAQATPAPSPSASAQAGEQPGAPPSIPKPKPGPDNPKRHKLAVQQFLAWQQGSIDRTLYGDELNSELSDEVLDRATRTLANLGGLQSATFLGTSRAKGVQIYVYKMTCENGSVNMDFALGPDGKIALIFFE